MESLPEAKPLSITPPELEAHPDMEFSCPHCGESLTVSMGEYWEWVTKEATFGLNRPNARQTELKITRLLCTCAGCSELFKVSLEPVTTVVTYRVLASKLGPRAFSIGNRVLLDVHEPGEQPKNLKL